MIPNRKIYSPKTYRQADVVDGVLAIGFPPVYLRKLAHFKSLVSYSKVVWEFQFPFKLLPFAGTFCSTFAGPALEK